MSLVCVLRTTTAMAQPFTLSLGQSSSPTTQTPATWPTATRTPTHSCSATWGTSPRTRPSWTTAPCGFCATAWLEMLCMCWPSRPVGWADRSAGPRRPWWWQPGCILGRPMAPGWWRASWTFCSGTRRMHGYSGTPLSSRWWRWSWRRRPVALLCCVMLFVFWALWSCRWCPCWIQMEWLWETTAAR